MLVLGFTKCVSTIRIHCLDSEPSNVQCEIANLRDTTTDRTLPRLEIDSVEAYSGF